MRNRAWPAVPLLSALESLVMELAVAVPVGPDGMIEIKCPNTSTHIETLLGEPIADKYIKQMQWQMACAGRAWCDWISYDDRLPPNMALFVQRVHRDASMIAAMEREVMIFLREIDDTVGRLKAKFG